MLHFKIESAGDNLSKTVFISYASQNAEIARQICELLEQQHIDCWIAPRNIMPGQSYGTEIVKAIDKVDGLVVVLTHESNSSSMVQKEVERAVSKGKIIYPFRIENVTPSSGLEFFISSSHWIDAFNGNLKNAITLLVSALTGHDNKSSVLDIGDEGTKGAPDVTVAQPISTANDVNVREFQFHKARGVLINGSDGSRNIAFKVESMNSIFSTIRSQFETLADTNAATNMFCNAGRVAGENFGRVMNQKWDLASVNISLTDKITKWCEFDSDVGWGRLDNNVVVDESQGTIRGEIHLTENFLIFNKKKSVPCECHFMVGYTQGVLEEIFKGIPIKVACKMEVCPLQNPLKKTCVFQTSITE